MRGDEHYRRAEELLRTAADADPDANPDLVALMVRFAQAHATLAHAAAVIEAADQQIDQRTTRPLAVRPFPGDDVDPPYPGSPWGRALHGDLHLDDDKDS